MISKEDFRQWKSEPITEAFYEACLERVGETKDLLAQSAGLDQAQDNFYRGFIWAYREIFDFRIEEEE